MSRKRALELLRGGSDAVAFWNNRAADHEPGRGTSESSGDLNASEECPCFRGKRQRTPIKAPLTPDVRVVYRESCPFDGLTRHPSLDSPRPLSGGDSKDKLTVNERPEKKSVAEASPPSIKWREMSAYPPWDAERLAKLRAERDELLRKLRSQGKHSPP